MNELIPSHKHDDFEIAREATCLHRGETAESAPPTMGVPRVEEWVGMKVGISLYWARETARCTWLKSTTIYR